MPVVLTLALCALFCPPLVGYFLAFLTMLWLLGGVGLLKGRAPWLALPESGRGFVWTLFLGTLAFTLTALFASVAAALWGAYPMPLTDALEPFKHLANKRTVQWLIVGTALLFAYQRGFRLRQAGLPLATFLGLYFAYAVAQRTYGIDWVHGFDAKLPPNREAYGVFRVSGFMGHPISLSYNLMLFLLTVYAQLRIHGETLTPRERKVWSIAAIFAALNLVLSGSRWPLVVIAITLLLAEGKKLFRHAKWVGLGVVVAAVVLVIEGSLLSRVGEVFGGDQSFYERMPRLLFWRVHWQMFTDNPLFGVGHAASMVAAKDYYVRAGFADFRELYPAHNNFLQTLADGGLLGFAGLGALLAAYAIAMRRLTVAGIKHGLGLLLTATVVAGLMQNNLRDSTYLYALWLCTAFLAAEAVSDFRRR